MVVVCYASQLTFQRSLIEILGPQDSIRIIMLGAPFLMTKAQFDEAFSHVAQSRSYRKQGHYSYADIPHEALQFLVEVRL